MPTGASAEPGRALARVAYALGVASVATFLPGFSILLGPLSIMLGALGRRRAQQGSESWDRARRWMRLGLLGMGLSLATYALIGFIIGLVHRSG